MPNSKTVEHNPKPKLPPGCKRLYGAWTYSDLALASRLYVSLKPWAPIRGRGYSGSSCLACQWMSSTDNPCRSVRWSQDTHRLCAPERRRASARSACCFPDSHGKARRLISAPAMTAYTSSLCLSEVGDCMDGNPLMAGSVQEPRRWRRRVAWVRSCRKDSQHTPVLETSVEGRLGANREPKTELQQGHPRFHGWSRSPHNNYLWDPWSTCRSFPDSFTCIGLLYGVYVYFFI